MLTAHQVFKQASGDVTKAYYAQLNAAGASGELACALFRAQKRSEAAKSYSGGRFRRAAYDVKNWSLSEICRILHRDGWSPMVWGWKHDPLTLGYEWVLYVDLPQGQVSFHSSGRIAGPDYLGFYDGAKLSRERILAFCDWLLYGGPLTRILPETSQPIPEQSALFDGEACA